MQFIEPHTKRKESTSNLPRKVIELIIAALFSNMVLKIMCAVLFFFVNGKNALL